MEQRYYAVSVDKYAVVIQTDKGVQELEMWGTEDGIKEWITTNQVAEPTTYATYAIIEKGLVQKGEPIKEWKP